MTPTTSCMYCQSSRLEVLYTGVRDRLGHVDGTRTFLKCGACGSATLDHIPDESELAAFYPPIYSYALDVGKGSAPRRLMSFLEYRLFFGPLYRRQVDITRSRLRRGTYKHLKLLDIGCGRGLRLREFQRHGFDVRGVDVQADVVRYLNDDLAIPADVGGIGDLPRLYPSDSFDVVTAFAVVEHITDVRSFLRECRRLLRPGGVLVISIPLLDSLQSDLLGGRWANITEAPRHISIPTQNGIRTVFEGESFRDVRIVGDSVLNSAGQIPASLFLGASLTKVYSSGGIMPVLKRCMGGMTMLGALPVCWYEAAILKRPGFGIVSSVNIKS
jgi:SAM-dependent methyltransferase